MVHAGPVAVTARGEMGTRAAPSSHAKAHGTPRAGKRARRPRRGAACEHRPHQWAGHEDRWAQLQELGECKMPEGAPEPMHPRTPTSRQGFGQAGK